jgi:hypothetical protein
MTSAESMILAAKKQQDLTGKKDAAVSFIIPGPWPPSGTKRLAKRQGPVGQCVAEYEDACLCLFKADAVIKWCSKFIGVLSLRMDGQLPPIDSTAEPPK